MSEIMRAKSAIEQEIEWCKAHMGESANGIEFENGFIAGLKQALRFEMATTEISDDPQPGTLDYWSAVTSKDAGGVIDPKSNYTGCPKDLSEWVNFDPRIVWFLYDIDLLPEVIKTKEQVCGLRGFQYGWTARGKVEQQGSSSDDLRISHLDR